MPELERLLSQDDSCLISVASVKRALKQDSNKEKHMQYMRYMPIGDVVGAVNRELENGSKVVLMVPLLKTDNWGSHTAGYNVLFEKADDCDNSSSLTEKELFKLIRKQYGIEKTACCLISVHNPGQPEPPLYVATDWGERKLRKYEQS